MSVNSFQDLKFQALAELDRAEKIRNGKKNNQITSLIHDLNVAIKKMDSESIEFLCEKLKASNLKQIQIIQQTQAEKDKLSNNIQLIEEKYTNHRQPFAVSLAIKEAKSLCVKKKVEISELQNSRKKIENFLQEIQEKEAQAEKQALEEADKKALLEEQLAKKPQDYSANLKKLANFPPDKNGNNPYRPDWIEYDAKSKTWQVIPNTLANDIVEDFSIRRVEEKGKLVGYACYQTKLGQWEYIVPEGLGNYVDGYFSNPECYTHSDNRQYAEDLHTAKAVRDTLTLLKSKITKITPQNTFDVPPKYLVHLPSYDFDVLHWKKIDHSPQHYFLTGLNLDLDEKTLGWVQKILSGEKLTLTPDQVLRNVAPKIQKWFLESLGSDKETMIAFLERLGLSMINNYEDNFIVFLQGEASNGKSKLFDFLRSMFQRSDVAALDLDTMATKNSFDVQELRNKTINLTGETVTTSLNSYVENLLKLLSGNDLRNYSQKFLGTADFVNFAHLWFNMNHVPRLEYYDNAIARRIDLFKWNKIVNFEKDYDWNQLLQERSQLLVLALYYTHLLLNREKKYYDYCNASLRLTRSQVMIDNYLKWSDQTDYFSKFIKEKCQIKGDYKVGCKYLLNKFNDYLQMKHVPEVSLSKLDELLLSKEGISKSSKPSAWKDDHGKWNRGVYVYLGIATNSVAGIQNEEISFEKMQYNAGKARMRKMYN